MATRAFPTNLGSMLLCVAVLLLSSSRVSLFAQVPCPWPDPTPNCSTDANQRFLPSYATPASGCGTSDPCAFSGFVSQCWAKHTTAEPTPWEGLGTVAHPAGLKLNIDLSWGPTAPDFLPPGKTPADTSLALLPAELKMWKPASRDFRPTLNGAVDLVTGADLIQEQDLSLPFGSAEYRLVRTHAVRYPHLRASEMSWTELGSATTTATSGYFWDWFGAGWTSSSNPIFLIDSTLKELTVNTGTTPEGARCYFLADSFHTIPFTQNVDNGTYAAPPHFRATLTHNGTWSTSSTPHAWATGGRPTHYYLWLYDGAIKYTIKAYYTDIPEELRNTGSGYEVHSAHERPAVVNGSSTLSGTGMPNFGLVKKIEDRYGNHVDFFHDDDVTAGSAGFRQWHESYTPRESEGCWTCAQNCADKGQIRYAKLYSAGSSDAVWTLLFQHRRFTNAPGTENSNPNGPPPPEHKSSLQWLFAQTAVHGVYTYARDVNIASEIDFTQWKWVLDDWMFWKGPNATFVDRYDRTTTALNDQTTLPTDAWSGLAALDDIENYTAYPEFGPRGIPSTWSHHVKYLYSEPIRYHTTQTECRAPILNDGAGASPRTNSYANCAFHPIMQLLKTTIDTRTTPLATDGGTTLSDTSMYRYSGDYVRWDGIKSVLRPDTVRRLVKGLKDYICPTNTVCPCAGTNSSEFCLMRMLDTDLVPSTTQGEQSSSTVQSLESSADLVYREDPFYAGSLTGSHWLMGSLVNDYIGLDHNRLLSFATHGTGTSRVSLSDGEGGKRGEYRLYQFVYMPPGRASAVTYSGDFCHTPGTLPSTGMIPKRSLLHYPHRWQTAYPDGQFDCSPLYEPTWIMVVDKYNSAVDAEVDPRIATSASNVPVPNTRRVIQMNALGLVLKDKTWEFQGSTSVLTAASGFGAEYVYDSENRLTETRSAAWSTQTSSAARDSDGLIQVYSYAYSGTDPDGNADPDLHRRTPHLEGIKQGVNGTPVWQRKRWFHPQRKDLVIRERVYPSSGLSTFEENRSVFQLSEVPGTSDPVQYRVTGQDSITSASRKSTSTDTFRSVDKIRFDDTGSPIWHGYGSVQSASGAAQQDDEFYVDYTVRDERGRVLAHVVDYAGDGSLLPSHYPSGVSVPSLPSDLDRRPAHNPGAGVKAIQATTAYEYNDYGVSKVTYPTGRFDVVKYKQTTGMVRRIEYTNLNYGSLGTLCSGPGTVTSPGNSSGNGRPWINWVEEVTWVPDGTVVNPDAGANPLSIRTTITPSFDSSGRPMGLSATTGDGSSTSIAIAYAPAGEISRVVSTRGVITRHSFNDLGLLTHMYRGAHDIHPFWGNADPTLPLTWNDDMTLIEKRYFGSGVHDLNLPRTIRHYRQRVANQYLSSSSEDQTGWTEEREYDWRLRPVFALERQETTSTNTSPAAIRHTLTFYDNLDRPRYVATYGPTLPSLGSLDPRSATSSSSLPSAADILATNPAALSETVYNGRGEVEETREFNVDPSLTAVLRAQQYLANITFYGQRQQPTLIQSPNSGLVTVQYDALGREVSRSTFAGSSEVARAEKTYGPEGGAQVETMLERMSTSGTTLSGSNSVASVTYNFYDPNKRLVGAMDWGTGRTDGTFQSTASVSIPAYEGIENDLALTGTADARWGSLSTLYSLGTTPRANLTTYRYDERNLVTEMVGPTRSLTKYTYDDYGHLILMVENAGSTPWNQRRSTAYLYQNGLLTVIAALRNGATTPPAVWNNTNIYAQITRVEYGTGEVEYADNSTGTFSGELPKAIRFPRAPCAPDINDDGTVGVQDIFDFLQAWFAMCNGQCVGDCVTSSNVCLNADYNQNGTIEVQDIFDFLQGWFAPPSGCYTNEDAGDLVFTYTAEGAVKSRAFPNGSKFNYAYDELGRLTTIDVDDPTGLYVGAAAPTNAISHIGYSYDTLGRLTRSDAYAQAAAGTSGQHVVASSLFEYDGLSRLTAERLAIGQLATTSTPATSYQWDSVTATGPVASGIGASRLCEMTYPLTHQVGGSPVARKLAFTYGSSGSADDLLSRIREVNDVYGSTALAQFSYIGENRRVSTDRGVTTGTNASIAVAQSFLNSSEAVTGLDVFGRVKDLTYKGHNNDATSTTPGSVLTVFGAQHTYDPADNRLKDTVTRSVGPGGSGGSLYDTANNWSWVFTYDKLMRLASAKTGQPATGSPGIVNNEYRVDHDWKLDELGNWARPHVSDHHAEVGYKVSSFAVAYDIDNNPYDPLAREVTHRCGPRNELALAQITDALGTQSEQGFTYDRQGRLTSDGIIIHSYDAWGRLCEMRYTGLGFSGGNTPATPLGTGAIGALAAHYTYDGLGRLVATQKPASFNTNGSVATLQLTRHYYDGARRLQDQASSQISVDAPLTMAQSRWPSGVAASTSFLLKREYIYDPAGDVDQQIAQYGYTYPAAPSLNDSGTLLYVLQDANLNVVSLTDELGTPAAQIGYTPYGQPTFCDIQQSGTAPATLAKSNPVGHQGLFFDRFDPAAAASSALTLDASDLSHGYYHNRNRTLAPRLGRFVQRDPNDSGQALARIWSRGASPEVLTTSDNILPNPNSDRNLHAYLSGNVFRYHDPAGLFFSVSFTMGSTESMGMQASQATVVGSFISQASVSASASAYVVSAGSSSSVIMGAGLTGSASVMSFSGFVSVATAGAIGLGPAGLMYMSGTSSQIEENYRNGQSAERDFISAAESNGLHVAGRHVSVQTPFGQRVYDVVLRDPATGALRGVEVKFSTGAFTRNDSAARQQQAADKYVNAHGASAVGQYASLGRIESAGKILWTASGH